MIFSGLPQTLTRAGAPCCVIKKVRAAQGNARVRRQPPGRQPPPRANKKALCERAVCVSSS